MPAPSREAQENGGVWRESTLSRPLGRWSPQSQVTPLQSNPYHFLRVPLPLSQGPGQRPLQGPRPRGAVGQQQKCSSSLKPKQAAKSQPPRALSRQAGSPSGTLPGYSRSQSKEFTAQKSGEAGVGCLGMRCHWSGMRGCQRQILVAVHRSHGVGPCSPRPTPASSRRPEDEHLWGARE